MSESSDNIFKLEFGEPSCIYIIFVLEVICLVNIIKSMKFIYKILQSITKKLLDIFTFKKLSRHPLNTYNYHSCAFKGTLSLT